MTRPLAGSRRDLAGAFGAMLLLTATEAGIAKTEELDGPLLRIYQRWLPIDRERVVVQALSGDEPDWDARFDAYSRPWHDLMREIIELPARTPEGIQVKARVLRSILQNHTGFVDEPEPEATDAERCAWSLVTDMLGRAGA